MITKEDILKMVTGVSKRSRNIPENRLIHPEREWSWGVMVFLLLLIGFFILNAKRFAHFSNIESQLSDETSFVLEYKYGTMTEVLNRYDERERMFLELRQGTGQETSPAAALEPAVLPAASGNSNTVVEGNIEIE